MNKAFYITGIVLSVAFMLFAAYYIEVVSSLRKLSIYETLSYGNAYSGDDYFRYYDYFVALTREAAMILMPFIIVFIGIHILGLIRVKTRTVRVLSIIALAVSGIFLVWNGMMLINPGRLSFDEVGPAFLPFGLMTLGFSITGLVQSIRFQHGKTRVGNAREDLLDS